MRITIILLFHHFAAPDFGTEKQICECPTLATQPLPHPCPNRLSQPVQKPAGIFDIPHSKNTVEEISRGTRASSAFLQGFGTIGKAPVASSLRPVSGCSARPEGTPRRSASWR